MINKFNSVKYGSIRSNTKTIEKTIKNARLAIHVYEVNNGKMLTYKHIQAIIETCYFNVMPTFTLFDKGGSWVMGRNQVYKIMEELGLKWDKENESWDNLE